MGGHHSKPACNDSTKNWCKRYAPPSTGCKDHDGDFQCVCPKGYDAKGKGKKSKCTDIDECKKKNLCHSDEVCVNRKGSYICLCPYGFYRDLKTKKCRPINKCLESNGGCGDGAICSFMYGQARCSCNKGYSLDDLKNCVEDNVCLKDNGKCDKNSICTHNSGKPPTCECVPGWTGNDNLPSRTCHDVNECEDAELNTCGKVSGHPEAYECVNTQGTFACRCAPGYIREVGGEGCTKIDYCKRGNDCDQTLAVCVNERTSYSCKCIEGFSGSGRKGGCRLSRTAFANKPCELQGNTCTPYEVCTQKMEMWECEDMPKTEQLYEFFNSGYTKDTPSWIFFATILFYLLIIGGVIWIIKWYRQRSKNKNMGNAFVYETQELRKQLENDS